jgi:hypothetical protein
MIHRHATHLLHATCLFLFSVLACGQASASPTTVTVTGGLQSEAGCPGDYQPDCALTGLAYSITDDAWQASIALPSGSFQYFAALNSSFGQTYGLNGATPGGVSPITINLPSAQTVKFFYDDKTHWVTDNVNSRIVTIAAGFQSELGCSGDFDASCLRSWLEDVDGDGVYTLSATLPAGSYGAKVTINQSFDENYGLGGVRDGADITIVGTGSPMSFCYDSTSHILGTDAQCSAPVAAIPEPETYALMLAGLAAVGATVRRRKAA